MKFEKSCGAIVIKDNKVLIIKQKSGFYGFPKGHMENDETEDVTAIREVKEETNIEIEINKKIRYTISYPLGNNKIKKVVYFIGYPKNNEIKIQEKELISAEWVQIDEVEEILTFDNLKKLWRKAKQQIDKK